MVTGEVTVVPDVVAAVSESSTEVHVSHHVKHKEVEVHTENADVAHGEVTHMSLDHSPAFEEFLESHFNGIGLHTSENSYSLVEEASVETIPSDNSSLDVTVNVSIDGVDRIVPSKNVLPVEEGGRIL